MDFPRLGQRVGLVGYRHPGLGDAPYGTDVDPYALMDSGGLEERFDQAAVPSDDRQPRLLQTITSNLSLIHI